MASKHLITMNKNKVLSPKYFDRHSHAGGNLCFAISPFILTPSTWLRTGLSKDGINKHKTARPEPVEGINKHKTVRPESVEG